MRLSFKYRVMSFITLRRRVPVFLLDVVPTMSCVMKFVSLTSSLLLMKLTELVVFKNAILPQISGLALSLGSMVGGALITETIFSYPGIGLSLMKAIRNVDYTLISGCTLIISMCVLVANFAVDIVYGLLDPRVRAAQTEEG